MLFNDGMNERTSFLKHYIRLDNKFPSPNDCFIYHKNLYEVQTRANIFQKHQADKNSILGAYLIVNPTLETHKMYSNVLCDENDRKIISKYRVGCHMLKIQSGRLAFIPADGETRLCQCNLDIQTLEHVLFKCPLTEIVRQTHNFQYNNLTAFFNDDNLVKLAMCLKAIEKLVIE